MLTKSSEKTNILSSNQDKRIYYYILLSRCLVNKMMENFDKLQVKSQLKGGTFRILDVREMTKPEFWCS